MTRRYVDLSMTLSNDVISDPPFLKPHIDYESHEGTRPYVRLHAYLHRKEGDAFNAGYWYRRAKTEVFTGSLDEEWARLVQENLG